MDGHLVVNVDQLSKDVGFGSSEKSPKLMARPSSSSSSSSSSSTLEDHMAEVMVEKEESDEAAPLIGMGECRICQEEDLLSSLESPCACSGSLKYAHRKCVQHWCNEKGDITCEICHQPYQPGYTAPTRPPSDETAIDIENVWLSGTPLDVDDRRLLAFAEAERRLFENDYEDYTDTSNSGAAFCRSAALIQALSSTDEGGDADGDGGDASTVFSLFLLRAVGFLLPCYIMIWAISILQRRRQRQEAAALSAAQFAIVVQAAAQNRGLLIASAAPTPAPASPATAQLEHPQRTDT